MTLVIIYDAKYIEIKTSKKLARKMNKTIFLDWIKMIFDIKNWLWKLKFHQYKVPGAMIVNSQNTAIFLKYIHFFGKL